LCLLLPGVTTGTANLTSLLRSELNNEQNKWWLAAGAGSLLAIYAIGFFFGPAGLAASSLYAWVTVGAASGTVLAIGGASGGLASVVCSGKATYNALGPHSKKRKNGEISIPTCISVTALQIE
jgi:hypothetical protein